MSLVRWPTGLVMLATVVLERVAVAEMTLGAQGEAAADQTYMPAGALYCCVPEPVLKVMVAGAVRNDNTST